MMSSNDARAGEFCVLRLVASSGYPYTNAKRSPAPSNQPHGGECTQENATDASNSISRALARR